jgi:hypothetical protein
MRYAPSIIVCLLLIAISNLNSIKTLHTLWNERPTCHQDRGMIWRLFERSKNEDSRKQEEEKQQIMKNRMTEQ